MSKKIKELKEKIDSLEKEYKAHYYDNDSDMYLDMISQEKSKAKKQLNALLDSKKGFKKTRRKKTMKQRLGLSNARHKHLMKKHKLLAQKTSGKTKTDHIRKHNYHSWVLMAQKDDQRIQDLDVRKGMFKHVVDKHLID